MEQVTISEANLGNMALNLDKLPNNQELIGDLINQGSIPLSFNLILANLTNEGSESMIEDCKNSLLSQLSDILNTSNELDIDLMDWFNELSNTEQTMVYNMLNNIVYSTNNFQSENQEINYAKSFGNNQHILQNTFNFLNNNNLLLDNNKELQKIFNLIEENKSEVKSMLNNVLELGKDNLIKSGDKSINNTNYLIDSKTINLQNDLLLSSMPKFNKGNFLISTDQDIEPKMLDLNQLQINLNGIINEGNVDAKLVDNKQSSQNLVVDKNFTEELGKIIIKNLKLPNGETETKIQLQPKELGQVNVKLSTFNGQISAQIIAETMMGKEMLESQIHQLKSSLVLLGFQVDKIDVQQATTVTNNQATTSSNQHNSSFGFSEQQPSQQQKYEQDGMSYLDSSLVDEGEFLDDSFNVSGIDYTV